MEVLIGDGLDRPLDLEDARLPGGDGEQRVEDANRIGPLGWVGQADICRAAVREHEGGRSEHAVALHPLLVIVRERVEDVWILDVIPKALNVETRLFCDALDHLHVIEVQSITMTGGEQRWMEVVESALPSGSLGSLEGQAASDGFGAVRGPHGPALFARVDLGQGEVAPGDAHLSLGTDTRKHRRGAIDERAAPDIVMRLLPFAAAFALVAIVWRPSWLGLGAGDVAWQLGFGAAGAPVLFVAAMLVQRWLARRRSAMSMPAGTDDAWFQAGFYVVNGPIEEAFFRGLIQGGLSVLVNPVVGFAVGTAAYVLYHRLGRWSWADTLATALVGVPLGLAFWLLPGAPSLLGVSIAHGAHSRV